MTLFWLVKIIAGLLILAEMARLGLCYEGEMLPHQLAVTQGLYESKRNVSLTWDAVVPIAPGHYSNVSLSGFDDYKLVFVFISDAENMDDYYKLDVSGAIGHLQFTFPDKFEAWSLVRVAAIGIPGSDEDHPPNELAVALDKAYYVVGDVPPAGQEVSYLVPYGHHSFSRSAASVWINGNPTIIRRSQTITIVWSGFASNAYIAMSLVCPRGHQEASCVPVASNYNTIPISYTFSVPQTGCFVTATQSTFDIYTGMCTPDPNTAVRSSSTYVLMQ